MPKFEYADDLPADDRELLKELEAEERASDEARVETPPKEDEEASGDPSQQRDEYADLSPEDMRRMLVEKSGAIREERSKRKALSQRIRETEEYATSLETRMRELMAGGMSRSEAKAEAKEEAKQEIKDKLEFTDPMKNPLKAVSELQEAIKRDAEERKREAEESQKRNTEAERNRQQLQRLVQSAEAMDADFQKENPWYSEATQHLARSRAMEYAAYIKDQPGSKEQKGAWINERLNQDWLAVVHDAAQRGLHPSEVFVSLARARGYVPPQERQAQPAQQENVRREAEPPPQNRSRSLSSVAGKSADRLVDMDPVEATDILDGDDFDKFFDALREESKKQDRART